MKGLFPFFALGLGLIVLGHSPRVNADELRNCRQQHNNYGQLVTVCDLVKSRPCNEVNVDVRIDLDEPEYRQQIVYYPPYSNGWNNGYGNNSNTYFGIRGTTTTIYRSRQSGHGVYRHHN